MTRPFVWLAIAIAASPAIAWLVYRLARGLGFLEPPLDRQHELRRTIVLAIYALLLFLPVLFYGFEKGWPRAWVLFGFVDGAALLFFAGSGLWAGRELWRIRHPQAIALSEPAGGGDAVLTAADASRTAEDAALASASTQAPADGPSPLDDLPSSSEN